MTGERRSPTVRRRRLANVLADLRLADGRPAVEIARLLGWSQTKITRLEHANGLTLPKPAEIARLLDLYAITGDQREQILTLAAECRERGWWDPYTSALTGAHAAYVGFEDAATVIRTYEALVIPGLLQTQAYARATIQGVAPALPADLVESRVEIRLHRQRLHLAAEGEQPDAGQPLKRLWAIFDEAVLHRAVGGPHVMRGQLQHLLTAASLPHVTLQVIPFEAGAHPGIPGSFTHLTFPQPLDPEVVYVDSPAGQEFIEAESRVAVFRGVFEALKSAALSAEKSRDMIEGQLKAMPDPDD